MKHVCTKKLTYLIFQNRKRKHAVQKYLVGKGGKEVRESDEANDSDSDKDQADPSLSKVVFSY